LRLAYSCWSKQLSLNAIRSIYASTILITLKNNNHTVILCRSSKDKSIGRCSHDCILPHRCLPCGLLPLSFIAVTSFGSDVRLCPFCFVLLHLVQCCCSMSALYNFISPLRLGMSLTASCTSLVIPVCHSLGLHNNLLLSTFLPSPSFFPGHLPLLQIAQIHVRTINLVRSVLLYVLRAGLTAVTLACCAITSAVLDRIKVPTDPHLRPIQPTVCHFGLPTA